MEGGKITMETVAQLANVSKSTVSRALAGNPSISQSTKDRINEIIKEHGYTPNEIARSLARKTSQNIGLIIPSDANSEFFSTSFFQGAIDGITEFLGAREYDILIPPRGMNEVEAIKRGITGKKADGFIYMRSYLEDHAIEYLKTTDFPFVIIGSYKDEEVFYCVDNNTYDIAYVMTKEMISRGKKRIAMLGPGTNEVHGFNKVEGYKAAIRDFAPDMEPLYFEGNNAESVHRMLAMRIRPDCVIVDDAGSGTVILDEMKLLGYADIKNSGIDIACLAGNLFIHKTGLYRAVIDTRANELGYKSAEKLIQLINGEQTEYKTIVPFDLYSD